MPELAGSKALPTDGLEILPESGMRNMTSVIKENPMDSVGATKYRGKAWWPVGLMPGVMAPIVGKMLISVPMLLHEWSQMWVR